jgi:hypothetical protein
MSLRLRCLGLLLLAAARVAGANAVDEELARFNEVSTRIDKTYQDGLAREKARSLPALVAIARREAGTPAAAAEAWKQVLILDPGHEEARRFFTALGKLDAVVAELQARQGPLLGKGETTQAKPPPDPRLDMTGARLVRIQSSIGQGVGIGNHKAGSTILVQYVSGAWASGQAKEQSPDAAESVDGVRLELIEDTGNEPVALATVPAGTAETPFAFTLEKNAVGLTLRIKEQGGRVRFYSGEVQYRVKILPPGR